MIGLGWYRFHLFPVLKFNLAVLILADIAEKTKFYHAWHRIECGSGSWWRNECGSETLTGANVMMNLVTSDIGSKLEKD